MIKEFFKAFGIAIIISFLIINFVIQGFYIPSGSMRPTLQPGDRIFINKFIYRFRDPKRQDIVVFKYPVNQSHKFIKRIIGLPGDEIKIVDGIVYVNGKKLREDYVLEKSYTDFSEIKIPKNHYFVLGDNRNNSEDSRFWGFVPRKYILGRAFIIYWPLSRIKLVER